jgi:uncharacterized membrane protein
LAEAIDRRPVAAIHPVHAILLASTIPLFLGALLTDWAYVSTYHIQWSNFSAWLILGGLVFAGLAMIWGLVGMFVASGRRRGDALLHLLLIVATFVVGIFNSLVHARDGWGAMPAGLILSVIVLVLAIAANWVAHARRGEGVAA